MTYSTLKFETRPVSFDSSVTIGVLSIQRPEALNALNARVIDDLEKFVAEVSQPSNMRALILTGAGEKAFVAGADIKEMKDHSVEDAFRMSERGQSVFNKISELPIPVIGAINGFALGGGLELAMTCDVLLASNKAKWGLPEVTLGLIPGYGGTQRLARLVGPSLAKRVALSGEVFAAGQGASWGLFAQLYEPSELMGEAVKLAETLAMRAPRAVLLAKCAIDKGLEREFAEGLKLERELFAQAFETEDHREGIAAFIEKRKAQFKGN